jgi:hypothetical protein
MYDGPVVHRLLIEASNEGTLKERNSAAVKVWSLLSARQTLKLESGKGVRRLVAD